MALFVGNTTNAKSSIVADGVGWFPWLCHICSSHLSSIELLLPILKHYYSYFVLKHLALSQLLTACYARFCIATSHTSCDSFLFWLKFIHSILFKFLFFSYLSHTYFFLAVSILCVFVRQKLVAIDTIKSANSAIFNQPISPHHMPRFLRQKIFIPLFLCPPLLLITTPAMPPKARCPPTSPEPSQSKWERCL